MQGRFGSVTNIDQRSFNFRVEFIQIAGTWNACRPQPEPVMACHPRM